MRLIGKWRILIDGDERVTGIFPWQRDGLNYLLNRLFSGENVAVSELERYGMTVRSLDDNDEIISVPAERD